MKKKIPNLMTRPPARKRAANERRSFLIPFILSCLFVTGSACAQHADSAAINKKRLRTLAITSGAGYTVAIAGLHQLWYKDFARRDFHFFNDLPEWKQVDKAGHFFSAYYLGYGTSRALRWCQVPQRRSDLIAAATGMLALLPIEIFDGYSEAYGASAGDLVTNAAGAAFFLAQQRLWNEQRIIPRFSFHYTGYPAHRAEVLGETNVSQVLKDYNGQTYWLSADMDKFTVFPAWLNVAIGYGAHEMVFARDSENQASGFNSYRQFYLGLDPDLSAIRTRSKVLKTLIFIAGIIKIPAPAVEFSRGKVTFHAFY